MIHSCLFDEDCDMKLRIHHPLVLTDSISPSFRGIETDRRSGLAEKKYTPFLEMEALIVLLFNIIELTLGRDALRRLLRKAKKISPTTL